MAELGLPSLGYDELVETVIRPLPYEMSMHAAAILQGILWHGDFRVDGRRHLALASRLMPGSPFLGVLGAWVAEDGHILFSEQAVLALQRLLVLYASPAPGRDFDADDHERFMQAVLQTPGAVLGRSRTPVTNADWQAFTLRGGHFASREEYLRSLGRSHHIWSDLARSPEMSGHPYHCPVWDWYETTYGRTIDEDEAVCMAAHFQTSGWLMDGRDVRLEELQWPDSPMVLNTQTLLRESKLRDRGPALLAGLAATREQLQMEFRRDERDPEAAAWGFLPFATHPLVEIGPDAFVPASPRLLEEWGTSGTYHRIGEAARRQGGKASFLRFTQFFGELTEQYVREVLEGGLGGAIPGLAPRVIPPQAYGHADGKETTDALVDCAPDMVAFEVYSGRLSQTVLVQGSNDAVQADLRRLITGKALQMARALGDLRSGAARVGPLEHIDPVRIFPLVVTVEGITETPVVRGQIDDELAEAWAEGRLEPLLLLGIDELEELAGRLEGGAELIGLLEAGLWGGWRGNGYSFFAGDLVSRSVSRALAALIGRSTREVAGVLFDSAGGLSLGAATGVESTPETASDDS